MYEEANEVDLSDFTEPESAQYKEQAFCSS